MTTSVRYLIAFLACGLVWAQAGAEQAARMSQESAGGDSFEETQPPKWTPAEVVEPGLSNSNDPLARKLDEVNSELDRAQAGGSQPAGAPNLPARENTTFQAALKAVGALFLVLALIYLFNFLFRRFGGSSPLLAGTQLAQVIGKVHLAPRVSLHFVRTGGKVLILGVAPSGVSLVAETDAAAYEDSGTTETADGVEENELSEDPSGEGIGREPEMGEMRSFLDELKADLRSTQAPASKLQEAGHVKPSEDEDIDALRKDLQRLQRYLQESAHRGGKE